jgi:hypothetical protein
MMVIPDPGPIGLRKPWQTWYMPKIPPTTSPEQRPLNKSSAPDTSRDKPADIQFTKIQHDGHEKTDLPSLSTREKKGHAACHLLRMLKLTLFSVTKFYRNAVDAGA